MTVVQILIAAGNAAEADELAALAEATGYLVKAQASSGKEAIELAKTCHPDLVLMDTHLHGDLETLAVVEKLQTPCSIPVVLVAASDEDVPFRARKRLFRSCAWSGRSEHVSSVRYSRGQFTGHSREPATAGTVAVQGHTPVRAVRKIAHDINNSLSSALANIQLSRRSCTHEEHLHGHLDRAEESVLRARDHSRQLLTPLIQPGMAVVHRGEQVPKKQHPGAGAQKKGTAAWYRILLMDDEAAILSATSEMLSFLGHEVTVAENGDVAIDLYAKALADAVPFDAVILDVTVPDGKGAQETLSRLQAIDPHVRAIVSTGYATHPLVVNFATGGFVAALIKPYGFKELEESLALAFRS